MGRSNLNAQTEQVLLNLETALEAAEAGLGTCREFTIWLVLGQNPQEGFWFPEKMRVQSPLPGHLRGSCCRTATSRLAHRD